MQIIKRLWLRSGAIYRVLLRKMHGLGFDWRNVDAWLERQGEESASGISNWWSRLSSFFARFRVFGFKRFLTELISESTNIGTAVSVVMLTLALPAFDATMDESWKDHNQYSITFLDRYGKKIGSRGILQGETVPLEEIPEHMIAAALATEDRRFFSHFGIDLIGTSRALMNNLKSEKIQGGSSITQQLAKNLFLSSKRTLKRKIKEAFLAVWLEWNLSKNEILHLYFNRAYMGGGAFGLEAASRLYFDKSIRDITLAEAAILAGMFKAPTRYAPHNDLAAARARANVVLNNLVDSGFMSEGEVHNARANPAALAITVDETYSPDYFLDWAFEEVKRLMIGRPEFTLRVQTTIDIPLQKFADRAIGSTLQTYGRSRNVSQAAMVSMETDGAVRAVVGGADYGVSQFNRATVGRRQPGSSFKAFVYLNALQHGLHENSRVSDGPVSCGRWSPKNYSGGYRGAMTATTALKRSINTVAVKLSLRWGRDSLLDTVQKLGLKEVKRTCSMALGDTGITVMQNTAAYAVLANGGKSVTPYGILEIFDDNGNSIYRHDRDEPEPSRIFEPEHIEALNRMLQQVILSGTGRRAGLDFTHAAGKTGTSSSYRDAWFMGFTGQYVTGVWFGNDNYQPTNRVTGGNLPTMAWKQFMNYAHSSLDIPDIPGIPSHPQQIAERKRIAKENNSLAEVRRTRGMSDQTRKILLEISSTMKNAKRLATAVRLANPENTAE